MCRDAMAPVVFVRSLDSPRSSAMTEMGSMEDWRLGGDLLTDSFVPTFATWLGQPNVAWLSKVQGGYSHPRLPSESYNRLLRKSLRSSEEVRLIAASHGPAINRENDTSHEPGVLRREERDSAGYVFRSCMAL